MQNFTRSVRQRYVVSKTPYSLLRNDTKQYTILNPKLARSTCYTEANRFRIPVIFQGCKDIRKEWKVIQSLCVQCSSDTLWYHLPGFGGVRSFSTSTSSRDASKPNPPKDPGKRPNKKPGGDPEKDEPWTVMLTKFLIIVGTAILLVNAVNEAQKPENTQRLPEVSWNEFVYHMLAKGEVDHVAIHPMIGKVEVHLHRGAVYKGNRLTKMDPVFLIVVPDIEAFESKVRELEESFGIKIGEGVPITYERGMEQISNLLNVVLWVTLIAFIASQFRKNGPLRNMNIMQQFTQAKFTLVEPSLGKGVRFDDVAGLKEAKVEIMEFVDYLKHPQRYKELGAKIPKGALLLGPPGCGKTLLAKAVATESNVPFLSMNGSEFIEMLGGLGAARVRDLFKEARRRAPSIVYIDEIDAIGRQRANVSMGGTSETERTLNQLLVEMDGMITREDVIIMASTNRADVLDKALLRPGRFDRHILIDLPNLHERRQIFENHLRTLVLDAPGPKYSPYLAQLTPGFSGADIANVCNEAALHAARVSKKKVDSLDLMYAIDRTIAGAAKVTNTIPPSTKKVVAYHEAGHALVAWLLEYTDALLKVTIVPRVTASLGFAQYTPSDKHLHTQQQMFETMCVMLGGRVAEQLIFNEVTNGATNDLQKVTKLAYSQVQQYGMSPTVGLISFTDEEIEQKYAKLYSKKLGNVMDSEVRRITWDAYKATEAILIKNRDKLTKLAEELLAKETLTYNDVEKLIGPPPFGHKRVIEAIDFEEPYHEKQSEIPKPIHT